MCELFQMLIFKKKKKKKVIRVKCMNNSLKGNSKKEFQLIHLEKFIGLSDIIINFTRW